MSRTRKGSKGPGYEVDRKREGKAGYRSAGALAKRIAVRAGRRLGKAEIERQACAHSPVYVGGRLVCAHCGAVRE